MEVKELQQRIAEFPRWHYRFEFENGVTTPIFVPGHVERVERERQHVNRVEQKRRYFFDPLVRLTGGSLRGHRVLDLGCNAGFWSLKAVESGADFVLGIDGRQMHVDQANLVFAAKGIDPSRYRFEAANILEHTFSEHRDVVLCLGLLYHIAKPFELFERMTDAGAELIVIDTAVFRASGSLYKVKRENLDHPLYGVDYTSALVPTRDAVVDLAGQFGFKAVPLLPEVSDYTGMSDYRSQRRVAFICSRTVALDDLAEENRSPVPQSNIMERSKVATRRVLRRALGRMRG